MSLPLIVSPCVVSSAFGVIERAEAQLVPLHSAPGKGQCRAESHLEGHQKTPRCHLTCWLARESTPFLRRTPVLTLCALAPFCRPKKCGTFPDFPGEHRTNKFFSQRLQLRAVHAEVREGTDRLTLPVSSTPWQKAGPHLLLEF